MKKSMQVFIRVSPEEKERMKVAADKIDRSVSGLIRVSVDEKIKKINKQNA